MSLDWSDGDDENRGRLSRVTLKKTDDSGSQQLVDYDGVADETHTEVYRAQTHGFSSHAPAGSEGLVLALNARDAPIVIGSEHKDHRPKGLREGGSRQYDTAGSYVDLDADGNVSVKANGKAVTIEGATSILLKVGGCSIEITGGGITVVGDMNQSGVHVDNNGPHTA